MEIEKELARLDEGNQRLIDERTKKKEKGNNMEEKKKEEGFEEELITIDDFTKLKLKVAEVISCEEHPKADKLVVLKLKIGDEVRQVVAGIKKWYTAEDLVGKKVIVVVNL